MTEQLSKEGHDITVVDQDVSKVAELTNLYDVMGITGNGASYNVQMEAGIENCDLIIAVTDSDELNLLCCTVAKKAGDCAAVARVRTPDYSRDITYLREKLGLTMIINPDLEAARETARILYPAYSTGSQFLCPRTDRNGKIQIACRQYPGRKVSYGIRQGYLLRYFDLCDPARG